MNRFIVLSAITGMLFLHSCIVSKKVDYLKDMVPDSAYHALQVQPLQVQKGDRLRILVQAKDMELAAPFNMESGGYQVASSGDIAPNNSAGTVENAYLVNHEGYIDFPVFGKLNVVGLSLDGVNDLISGRIKADKLINEPIVRVELLNLRVNVMGEVNRMGVIDVPDGNITLLDAISRSGGLSLNAAPEKIAVIREENGVRKMVLNNLESKEIFNSPTYFLRQNDIVYVMPKGPRMTPREEMGLRYTSFGLSILAVILTTITLLK